MRFFLSKMIVVVLVGVVFGDIGFEWFLVVVVSWVWLFEVGDK